MLTANRLEKIMELEKELRSEYQQQLDDKQTAIDAALAEKADLQATIDKQLETTKGLAGKAGDTQKIEQRNRELHKGDDNLQGEIAELKQRLKALQKDLNAVREENKPLNQLDPARMKKNLDASKKKIAEKQKGNESPGWKPFFRYNAIAGLNASLVPVSRLRRSIPCPTARGIRTACLHRIYHERLQ
jgi:hypothetical protein